MNITQKFDYIALKSVTSKNGHRYYVAPDGSHLDSVTTILSATKDMAGLDAWRERVGDKTADREIRDAVNVGNLMHNNIERHILGMERVRKSNLVHALAYDLAENIINNGLIHCDEIWGVEVPLYYPNLYAGTSDLIGLWKGKPSIMDHKNSKKMKKQEWLEDYFLQGVAYSFCHNKLYDTQIKQVVIFMAARNKTYENFVLEGNEFNNYCDKWIRRLEQYYENK